MGYDVEGGTHRPVPPEQAASPQFLRTSSPRSPASAPPYASDRPVPTPSPGPPRDSAGPPYDLWPTSATLTPVTQPPNLLSSMAVAT